MIYVYIYFFLNLLVIRNTNSVNIYENLDHDTILEQYFSDLFNNLQDLLNEKAILIFNMHERIIQHLKIQADEILIYFLELENKHYHIINRNYISIYISNEHQKTKIFILSENDSDVYINLKRLGYNVKMHRNLFTNLFSNKKANLILKLVDNTEDIVLKNENKCSNVDSLHLKISNNRYFTYYIVQVSLYDTMHFENLCIKEYSLDKIDKISLDLFSGLKNLFESSIIIIDNTDKIFWINAIIENCLDFLILEGLLIKKIEIMSYPEIISILFPFIFVSTQNSIFKKYELVKFGICLNDLCKFLYFEEYFNSEIVEKHLLYFDKIVFSKLLMD